MFSIVNIILCFFKQKTAYEMRISDWSSDVCSSDLKVALHVHSPARSIPNCCFPPETSCAKTIRSLRPVAKVETFRLTGKVGECRRSERLDSRRRSEEHTSELQ